jgi:hypothetical protein
MPKAARTAPKQLLEHSWKPGVSGNPNGRPKGSRDAITEQFLSDVLKEWEGHGAVAISDMREKNPGDFVKMVASLLPKDVNLNVTDNLSELSDDELIGRIRDLSRTIAPFIEGIGGADGGSAEKGREAPLPN